MSDKHLEKRKLAFKLGYELGLDDAQYTVEHDMEKTAFLSDFVDLNKTALVLSLAAMLGVPFVGGLAASGAKNTLFRGPYDNKDNDSLTSLQDKRILLSEWKRLADQAKGIKKQPKGVDTLSTSKGVIE